jgi:hypothetical protein
MEFLARVFGQTLDIAEALRILEDKGSIPVREIPAFAETGENQSCPIRSGV